MQVDVLFFIQSQEPHRLKPHQKNTAQNARYLRAISKIIENQ
jgi:hypothetical protein